MTPDNTKALWNGGHSLWQSLTRYGPPEEAKEFSAIPSIQPLAAAIQNVTALFSKDSETIKQGAAAQELANRGMRLRLLLEAHIKRELLAGRLIAVGYAVPRRPADAPVILPIDTIQKSVEFHNDTVKGNGLEFVAVRITQPPPLQLLQDGDTDRRKPGRPSVRAQIEMAFLALQSEGKIDLTVSLASHFPAIRSKSVQLSKNTKKIELSDKVLYKWLPNLIEAAKKVQ